MRSLEITNHIIILGKMKKDEWDALEKTVNRSVKSLRNHWSGHLLPVLKTFSLGKNPPVFFDPARTKSILLF